MGNLRLLQILEQVLGRAKLNDHTGEAGFHCPFCKHHKKKFNIHVPTEKGEYGPAEDVHMILDHLIGAYLTRMVKEENN